MYDCFPKTYLGKPYEGSQSVSSNYDVSHCEISEGQLGDALVRKLEFYPSKGSDWHSTVIQEVTEDSLWWVSYEHSARV